jgi:hypothetical protein
MASGGRSIAAIMISPEKDRQMGITSDTIKIIAIIAMTIDHIALIFFPRYSLDIPVLIMHIIGRITAPIMMFFIVEGYYHTHNIRRYLFRLFIFAILSHFSYVIAFDKNIIPFKETIFDQTSIIWTLGLGLLALIVHTTENRKIKNWQKHIIIGICMFAAFPADWSSPAALSILYMGINKDNFKRQMLCLVFFIAMYSIVYCIFLNRVYGLIQMLSVLAIPILYQYNGQRGKWKGVKWFFYVYYPVHLIVLGLIRIFILNNLRVVNSQAVRYKKSVKRLTDNTAWNDGKRFNFR